LRQWDEVYDKDTLSTEQSQPKGCLLFLSREGS
jgi:hypothetical protein